MPRARDHRRRRWRWPRPQPETLVGCKSEAGASTLPRHHSGDSVADRDEDPTRTVAASLLEGEAGWMLEFVDGTKVVVPEGGYTIGRDKGNDLCMEDQRLSRWHCSLSWSKGSGFITLTDMSTNGTFVGEHVVKKCARVLESGARVEVVKGLKVSSD